ncbi:TM2 domain-containing protein [Actinomyces qiguomingii]|uniref:TM2 domain-containing protein n=1 Tax=Actinomyces qiguomingii TaxID=2057800 RepID=UPI000CA035F5|nr:TM2 domain-containing protein [Actinomyces qiguomingii]
MTSSPFSAPEPQNIADSSGASTTSYAPAEGTAAANQQFNASGGAYPPGYEQTQQFGQQQPYYQDPAAAYGQPYATYYNQKSKVAAGLLGIFLGGFGIHNFYLGYNGKAIAQLLITLLSFGLLAVVSGIWGLVEGIIILTATPGAQPWGVDARGVPLSS